MIKRKCKYCNKILKRKIYIYQAGKYKYPERDKHFNKRKFCNSICMKKYYHKRNGNHLSKKKKCPHCNKLFNAIYDHNYKRYQKYCSNKCASSSKRKTKVISCGYCGKRVKKHECYVKRKSNYVWGKLFCSRSCASNYMLIAENNKALWKKALNLLIDYHKENGTINKITDESIHQTLQPTFNKGTTDSVIKNGVKLGIIKRKRKGNSIKVARWSVGKISNEEVEKYLPQYIIYDKKIK